MRRRVLFAIGSMGGGGAERQTLHYLRHLDRDRFSPSLYLHYDRGELRSQVPDDVPVISFWNDHHPPRWNYPGRIHRLQCEHLAKVLEQQQIDALCAIAMQLVLVASSSTRQRPTSWMAVEMVDLRLSFKEQAGRFRWFKKRALVAAYRRADLPVAVSRGVREAMRQMYRLPADRIATLPNFVDLEEVDRQATAEGPELDLAKFHLVMLGRLGEVKGHRYLLAALDELVNRRNRTQLHLHLLGQGPLEEELRGFVARRNLQDHVTFAGFVSNPFAYMRRCQLFCFPTLNEGLPLALVEAVACRIPVLAADCPSGPSEILDGGRFGHLVPPADSLALVRAIEEIVDDYQTYCRRTAAARQYVEQNYSVPAGMRQLENLLDRLAQDR